MRVLREDIKVFKQRLEILAAVVKDGSFRLRNIQLCFRSCNALCVFLDASRSYCCGNIWHSLGMAGCTDFIRRIGGHS